MLQLSRFYFATLFVCSIAFGVSAQEVPATERGIWNMNDCDDPRAAVALGRDFAILFEAHPVNGSLVTMGPVKWSGETAVLWQGGAPTVLPPPKAMTSCANMPPIAYAAMGEALALFSAFETIGDVCDEATGRDCATAVFAFADVSNDDRLSVAEITRLMRAGAVFVSYEAMIQSGTDPATRSIKVPVNRLMGTAMFLSLTGPMVTRNLLASYDFDGDGFLKLDEIMQDREPLLEASVSAATGSTLGAAFAQSMMSEGVGFLMNSATQMLGPMLEGAIR